jgi:hypothetical protein
MELPCRLSIGNVQAAPRFPASLNFVATFFDSSRGSA